MAPLLKKWLVCLMLLAKRFEQGLQKIKNNGTDETLIRRFETRLALH